jgi:pantoate--beta-alanine ligase
MNIVSKINDWKNIRNNLSGKKIGFIPTMGSLHEGHLSLCDRSFIENEITVVSIFINPTQFNQVADFDLYPRNIENDKALLEDKIDFLFIPDANEMYADNYQIQIVETELARELEGEYRPGHFSGMLTVVLKLLNLIEPDKAYFGEKDYQQLLLVKKMVEALFLPVEIIGCETVRAEDGLALSSRNARLNEKQREMAKYFPRLLRSKMEPEMIAAQLQQLGMKVDYIVDKWQRRLGAVWIDNIRLIDNVIL